MRGGNINPETPNNYSHNIIGLSIRMEQSLVIKVTIADGPGLSTSPVASAPSVVSGV